MQRRKKIIAGLIIFLLFMWVCTLVSKSIYVSTLPMVTTISAENKYIEHRVEAEGMVEAGQKQAITSFSGLRVKEIAVKAGDQVNIGDLLFTVDLADLEEKIQEKQAECAKIQLQMNTLRENQAFAAEQKKTEEERAREDYDELARYMNTLVGRATEEVAKAKKELEEGRGSGDEEALEKAFQAAVYAEADAKRERDQALKEAERSVENSTLPDNSDATLSVYQLELSILQEKMTVYEEILKKEGQVVSDISGKVIDIFIETGGRIPDTAVMLLSDDTVPCQFKVLFTKEQKKYLNLYDEVTLKLDGSKELHVSIEYLFESDVQPGSFEGRVTLPPEVGMHGISGILTYSETGQKYEYCIPPHMIHGENNRKYVYVLEERAGILGMEYYIEEVNIKILDENESWAAIEGAISKDSLLIENSTKEIKNGDIVRWNK